MCRGSYREHHTRCVHECVPTYMCTYICASNVHVHLYAPTHIPCSLAPLNHPPLPHPTPTPLATQLHVCIDHAPPPNPTPTVPTPTRIHCWPTLLHLASKSVGVVMEEVPSMPQRSWVMDMAQRLRGTGVGMVTVDTACCLPVQVVGKAFDK